MMTFVCSLLLEICPLDGLGCLRVTKVVVDLRKFLLPYPLSGFTSEEPNYIFMIVQKGLGLKETRPFVSSSTEMYATFVVG
jgi:hypothetical protein